MVPFRLQYEVGRRDRLAVESTPHLPACAAALGFSSGIVYLAAAVSPWFLLLLVWPTFTSRKFFALLLELIRVPRRPVDVLVEADRLGLLSGGERVWLYLDGVIQMYRTEGGRTWTMLHVNGSVLTIPRDAITAEQVEFLQGFALAAWRRRRATQPAA
ncbi:MAG: hypothetical protein U0804_15795 [Gemmataceae bacterium]